MISVLRIFFWNNILEYQFQQKKNINTEKKLYLRPRRLSVPVGLELLALIVP